MERIVLVLISAVIVSLSASLPEVNQSNLKIVCYLGGWPNFSYGAERFLVKDIEPRHCTHLIYGFVNISPENNISKAASEDDAKIFKQLHALKEKNRNLKILLAIRNWNANDKPSSLMFDSIKNRNIFLNNVINLLKLLEFDGVDINWEYSRGKDQVLHQEKQNLISLLKEMNSSFALYNFILTATVSVNKQSKTNDISLDIIDISKYLHFINLRDFSLHYTSTNTTSHISPLYSIKHCHSCFNYEASLAYWIKHKVPSQKLVLAIPFFGRSFTLKNISKNSLGAPVLRAGKAGPFLRERGILGHNEICRLIKDNNWTVRRDKDSKSSYAFKGNQWVGYDDEQSIKEKIYFLKSKNLGGIMVWTLEADDFQGRCGKEKFPLLKTIKSLIAKESKSIPAKDATTKSDSQSIINSLPCPTKGAFPYPNDCRKFYICVDKKSGFDLIIRDCPKATKFDADFKTCLYEGLLPNC